MTWQHEEGPLSALLEVACAIDVAHVAWLKFLEGDEPKAHARCLRVRGTTMGVCAQGNGKLQLVKPREVHVWRDQTL